MRIESLDLNNIRSYKEESVDLDTGLVLLYGENGAGKSSLLGSIFGGLYMSDALKYMDSNINLDSLVRYGADEGKIILKFGINGDTYKINWVISVKNKDGERKASTKSCVLEGENIDDSVEGVRDVKNRIEKIIGLSAESFVNSVFIQQGDITRMVNADDNKRREIIDGLLGLSKVDRYIDRMDKVRLEYKAKRRNINNLLDDRQKQLQKLPEESELQDRIGDLKSEKVNLNDKESKVEAKREKLRQKRVQIQQKKQKYEDKKEKFENIKQEVKNKEERKNKLKDEKQRILDIVESMEIESQEIEKSIEEKSSIVGVSASADNLDSKIEEINEKLSHIRQNITKIEEGDINSIRDDIKNIESDISESKDKIQKYESDIESLQSELESKKEEVSDLEEDIAQLEEDAKKKEDSIDQICDNLNIEYKSIQNLRNREIPKARDEQTKTTVNISKGIGEKNKEADLYRKVIEQGMCPVCGEKHENTADMKEKHRTLDGEVSELEKKLDAVLDQDEKLEKVLSLTDELQNINNEISIKCNRLDEKKQDINRSKDKISELEDEISNKERLIKEKKSDKSSLSSELSELESELEDLENRLSELNDEKSTLESLKSDIEDMEDIQNEIDGYKKEAQKTEELRQEVQSQYIENRKNMKRLENELEGIDIKQYKRKLQQIQEKSEKLEEKQENISDRMSEVQETLASKSQTLKRVREVQSDISELENRKVEAFERENNAEDVIGSYRSVKSSLREENIGLLNKYSNQIFKSVYDNKTYQRMIISKQYDIKLVTGSGTKVDPKDLSGGERTIISLAIRAGVYKLLVDRNGSADTLPPFIMDEPTTYLDSSHVSNLQNVIDTITSWDVPQVLVVSHRENMIQNADAAYRVEKDTQTETSRVSRKY